MRFSFVKSPAAARHAIHGTRSKARPGADNLSNDIGGNILRVSCCTVFNNLHLLPCNRLAVVPRSISLIRGSIRYETGMR